MDFNLFETDRPNTNYYSGPSPWYESHFMDLIFDIGTWFAYGMGSVFVIYLSAIFPLLASAHGREELRAHLPNTIRWAMMTGTMFAVLRTGIILFKS